MKGLVSEGLEIIDSKGSNPAVRDAGLIAAGRSEDSDADENSSRHFQALMEFYCWEVAERLFGETMGCAAGTNPSRSA